MRTPGCTWCRCGRSRWCGRWAGGWGSRARPSRRRNWPGCPSSPTPAPSHLFTSIRRWFAQAGLQPRRINTCNPLHVIARLASAGTGAALLPLDVIEDCPDRTALDILAADPAVAPHLQCAMWWIGAAEAECAMLAELAAEIGRDRFGLAVAAARTLQRLMTP